MSGETSLATILRWRLEQAASDAPLPPSARNLLEAVRPWWETWPERFQASVERLGSMQLSYGYATTELAHGRAGYPVPALLVGVEDIETTARVLYLSVRDERLRLRFQLELLPFELESAIEVTFVSDTDSRPVLSAPAMLSVESEYRLDVELTADLAREWHSLRVTDRMPFRFILRSTLQLG